MALPRWRFGLVWAANPTLRRYRRFGGGDSYSLQSIGVAPAGGVPRPARTYATR
jgi:hypothetical protein